MHLVTCKTKWKSYLKLQELRASDFIASHFPYGPIEYPCLVITTMAIQDSGVKFTHHIAYVNDVKKLLQYVHRKEKSSSSRVKNVRRQE